MKNEIINKKLYRILIFLLLAFIFLTAIPACTGNRAEMGIPTDLLPAAFEEAKGLPEIPHYTIKVEFDYANASYKGTALIDYTNLEGVPLDSIYLRLFPNGGKAYGNGSLGISNMKVDGLEVQTILSLEDTALEIKLTQLLDDGKETGINFNFNGRIPRDFDEGGYGIFSLTGKSVSLAGWYPILAVYDEEGYNLDDSSGIGDSVYSDMAYYDIELTAPSQLKVASTGIEVDSKNIGSGKTLYNLTSGPSRDFAIALGEDLKVLSKYEQGTKINAYYLPGHEKAARETLEIAVNSIKIFNKKFGPYLYNELDIIDAPMNGNIAVEFPGIVLISSNLYGDTVFTVHEIAHQWWYNTVGNDVIDDPWLDEALTTYSSAIYFEFIKSKEYGRQFIEYFEKEHKNNVDSGGDDIITEGLGHFEGLGPEHYSLIVYVKGALFFHSVRNAIGDEDFFKALQDYYQLKKYLIASPEDLLDQFELVSGIDLNDLYDEWLY